MYLALSEAREGHRVVEGFGRRRSGFLHGQAGLGPLIIPDPQSSQVPGGGPGAGATVLSSRDRQKTEVQIQVFGAQ